MLRLATLALFGATLLAAPSSGAQPGNASPVALAADVRPGRPLPLHIGGRVVAEPDGAGGTRYRRQWPGTYIEAAFRGPAVDLAIGPGEVALRIAVDGGPGVPLVRPAPGLYRIAAPGSGRHRIRIDVVSESQSGPTILGGLFAPPGTRPLPAPKPRARQIELIGDSHTVGYGNTAATRDCTTDQVWRTTDTARGPAGVLADRYGADYQVDAISGRGVVRNYDGADGLTVPRAYPYALLGGATPDRTQGWHPQLVVVALGTNDFTTALKLGERWPTQQALHADYERSYVAFVQALRRRHPQAFIVLWATDLAEGEIGREVQHVHDQLVQSGERNIAYVLLTGLRFAGCHAHPNLADDRAIGDAIARVVDARADIWTRRNR